MRGKTVAAAAKAGQMQLTRLMVTKSGRGSGSTGCGRNTKKVGKMG